MGNSWMMGLWVYGIGGWPYRSDDWPFGIGPIRGCAVWRRQTAAVVCLLDAVAELPGIPFVILPVEGWGYRWGVFTTEPDLPRFPWFTDAETCRDAPPWPWPDLPEDGRFVFP